MCLVRVRIGVNFEDDDMGRIIFVGRGIQSQTSWLYPNSALNFLLGRSLIGIELSGIDVDLRYARARVLRSFGDCATT